MSAPRGNDAGGTLRPAFETELLRAEAELLRERAKRYMETYDETCRTCDADSRAEMEAELLTRAKEEAPELDLRDTATREALVRMQRRASARFARDVFVMLLAWIQRKDQMRVVLTRAENLETMFPASRAVRKHMPAIRTVYEMSKSAQERLVHAVLTTNRYPEKASSGNPRGKAIRTALDWSNIYGAMVSDARANAEGLSQQVDSMNSAILKENA